MWLNDGADKSKAKNFQNMRHPPLLTGDPNMLILSQIVPPELHLMLGNHINPISKQFHT